MHLKNATRLGFRWLTKSIETITLRSFCRCYSLCFYISMKISNISFYDELKYFYILEWQQPFWMTATIRMTFWNDSNHFEWQQPFEWPFGMTATIWNLSHSLIKANETILRNFLKVSRATSFSASIFTFCLCWLM